MVGPWDGLESPMRREVELRAAEGSHHPDPQVAATADRWARRELSLRGTAGTWLGFCLSAVAAVLGDFGVGQDLRQAVADRRLAKRLVRLGPPPQRGS